MGPLHQWMLLPITSLWPNIFLEGTANALGWAYCTGRCHCQLHQLGPSNFWEVPLMHSDGPIALVDAAADYSLWPIIFLKGPTITPKFPIPIHLSSHHLFP